MKIASFLSVGWAESAAPMTTPKDGHFHARRQRITQTAADLLLSFLYVFYRFISKWFKKENKLIAAKVLGEFTFLSFFI